jgi:hypothetical protein
MGIQDSKSLDAISAAYLFAEPKNPDGVSEFREAASPSQNTLPKIQNCKKSSLARPMHACGSFKLPVSPSSSSFSLQTRNTLQGSVRTPGGGGCGYNRVLRGGCGYVISGSNKILL